MCENVESESIFADKYMFGLEDDVGLRVESSREHPLDDLKCTATTTREISGRIGIRQ